MEKLQLPHAKLFYYSAELYKNHTITENEKLKMKEMVINDEPQIFELLERYLSNGSEQEFINGLLALLRPHQKQLYQPIQPQQVEQPRINHIQPQRAQYEPPQQAPVSQPVRQQQQVQQQVQQNNVHLVPQQVEFQDSQTTQEQLNPLSNDQIAQFIEKHPDCPDEISSPLGLKLLKRKQRTQKANPQIKDYLKPYKLDQE